MDLEAATAEMRQSLPELHALYVFGSVATGDERPGSDVDLAVLAPRKLGGEERWRLQERVARRLGRSVDLVDLRAASTVMRVEVLRSGRVLIDASPAERELFEATSLSSYAHLNEARAGILADIKARGTVHG